MKVTPDDYPVEDLVELVAAGQLAIPEFQRNFVWRPAQVVDLLVSVARKWPVGSLLLLEGPADFAVRGLDGAPPLTEARLLILDGQQRVTALFQALGTGSADEIYVVDFSALFESGELGDEHIRSHRRTVFDRRFPTVERQADAGILPVSTVVDDAAFANWLRHFDGDEEKCYRIRREQLGGLLSYRIPAVRLPRDIEMGALAKIFETINRSGERLRAFDLMVARLYPHAFNLTEQFQKARKEHPEFSAYRVDGLELLRLIALRQNAHEATSDAPVTVKGIRQGDVLTLDAETVRENWDWAVSSYAEALAFVERECGVADPVLLPAATMLLPTALALTDADGPGPEAVKGWWWAAALSQSYSQGANTQAVKDARELLGQSATGRAPDVVQRFEPDPEMLTDTRRRNESFLRAVLALLVTDGARDWGDGRLLKASASELVLHQIFPAEYLKPRGIDSSNILNWTVLKKPTRARLEGLPPAEAFTEPIKLRAVSSHGLDIDALRTNDWQRFSVERRRALLGRLEVAAREARR